MSTGRDLSLFDQMSEEELAHILRADLAESNGSGLDTDTLLYVMELYAGRQTTKPPRSARDSYAAFRRQQGVTAKKRDCRPKVWRQAWIIMAAMALILVLGPSAYSNKVTTWKPIYQHHRDYRVLVCNSGHEQPVDIPVLAQQWYPRWLPEGYERVSEIWDDQEYINFYQFSNGGEFDTLIIRFGAITSGQRRHYFKNPEPTERLEHDGVEFYLYTNMQRNCAVGCLDGVVISVEGQISREELIRIIQSMPFQ